MTHENDEIAVLANPRAGRGRHRALLPEVVQRLRAAGRPVRVLSAGTAREAAQAARDAVTGGAGALVAVGGDGTVHLGLQAVGGTRVPFGVIPAGTGNDFAAGTGVPKEPLAAATAVADALREGRTTGFDLARITWPDGSQTWFGAVLAAGFDAVVNERANRMRWPRGPRRYDLAIVLETARLRPRDYTLIVDGVDHSFTGVLVAVGNCPSYGGGLRICPEADPADGLLDVVVGGVLGRTALARLKPRLRRGTHLSDPRVTSYRGREITIDTGDIIAYADGERIGPLPVTVGCGSGAVRLLR